MLIHNYHDVSISRIGVRNDIVCGKRWGAHFKLDGDTRELFPYINRQVCGARYTVQPLCIKFRLNDSVCTLYPTEAMASPFSGRDHAYEFIEDLVIFLNDLHDRRDQIEPDHKIYQQPVSVVDIVKVLPQTNCRQCGYRTCMAFAAALSKGEIVPARCPGFATPISVRSVYPVLNDQGTVEATIAIEIDGLNVDPPDKFQVVRKDTTSEPEKQSANADDKPLLDNFGIRIQKNLTSREVQVLRLAAEGASNRQISEKMGISHHTVKSHIIHIFNKISVNDRTQAAVWAVRNNVI